METLEEKQAALRERNLAKVVHREPSKPKKIKKRKKRVKYKRRSRATIQHHLSLETRASKGDIKAQAKLELKRSLKAAKGMRRQLYLQRKTYRETRVEWRKVNAAIRAQWAEALQAGRELQAAIHEAEARLRSSRASYDEVTVGAARAADIAKGYRLGIEAAEKGLT